MRELIRSQGFASILDLRSEAYVALGPVPDRAEIYLLRVVAAGVDDYSYARFARDYEDGLLMVLGSVTAVELLDMGDARGRDLVDKMVTRLDGRLGRIAA